MKIQLKKVVLKVLFQEKKDKKRTEEEDVERAKGTCEREKRMDGDSDGGDVWRRRRVVTGEGRTLELCEEVLRFYPPTQIQRVASVYRRWIPLWRIWDPKDT